MTSPAGVRGRPGSKVEHAVRVRRRPAGRLAALCIPHRKRLVTLLSRVRLPPARIKTEISVSEKTEVRALGGYDVHAPPDPTRWFTAATRASSTSTNPWIS